VIVNLRTREVQPMCELQPAFLAGMQSVQVHHPWPSRSATGPPLHHGPVAATPPEPTAGPVLWARCWGRIRTWRVPPRWSVDGLARRGPRPGGRSPPAWPAASSPARSRRRHKRARARPPAQRRRNRLIIPIMPRISPRGARHPTRRLRFMAGRYQRARSGNPVFKSASE
jgi:hypothetical protein